MSQEEGGGERERDMAENYKALLGQEEELLEEIMVIKLVKGKHMRSRIGATYMQTGSFFFIF